MVSALQEFRTCTSYAHEHSLCKEAVHLPVSHAVDTTTQAFNGMLVYLLCACQCLIAFHNGLCLCHGLLGHHLLVPDQQSAKRQHTYVDG